MVKLGTVAANLETATRAGEFIAIARLMLLAKGNIPQAAVLAETRGYSSRVGGVLKSAIAAGSLDGAWGSQLGEYPGVVAAFLDSLRNVGAFNSMLPAMKRVPTRQRVAMVTVGATGAIVPGGMVTPISNLTLDGGQLDEAKAVAMLVFSDELLKHGSGAGDLFGRELRSAIALVTDQEFISKITTGISPISSSGTTISAVRDDFAAALAAIDSDQASKFYVLMESATAKALATKGGESGSPFPQMSPQGGVIFGMPVIVSDGVTSRANRRRRRERDRCRLGQRRARHIAGGRHPDGQRAGFPADCIDCADLALASEHDRAPSRTLFRCATPAQRWRRGDRERELQRQQPGVRRMDHKLIKAIMAGIAPVIADHVKAKIAQAVAPLNERIRTLEAREMKYWGFGAKAANIRRARSALTMAAPGTRRRRLPPALARARLIGC